MKVYYICGRYKGKNIYQTNINIKKAEAVAIKVRKAGYVAVCPSKNTALFDGIVPDEIFLNNYFNLLKVCDGIVLMNGVKKFKGVISVLKFAIDQNILILNEDDF